jgi:hypothetical protein
MRKSTSKRRSRLVAAGITAGAVAALLANPQAAFAVAFGTQGLYAGVGGASFNITSSNLWTTATPAALLIPTSTPNTSACAVYAAPTSPSASATVVKVDNNTLTITIPTTMTLGTNGVAKQYSLCTYGSTTAGATVVNEGFFMVTPGVTISPTSGPSGGGTNTSVTFPTGTVLPGTLGSMWVPKATACPAAYSTANPNINGVVSRLSDTTASITVPIGVAGAGTTATAYNICLYSGTTNNTSAVLATSGSSTYGVSLAPVTLSSSIGAGGTASPPPTLLVSSTANFLTGISAPYAQFSVAACTAVYAVSAGYDAGILKTANNKGAVTVPASVTIANGPTYNVCLYNSNSTSTGRLIAATTYTVAVPPAATAILPAAGSSLGGDIVTITGSGFPTNPGAIRATLGGLPLTNINPIDPNTFTATTPTHAAEVDVPLVVNTDTGTSTLAAAFDYVNAISISPNTAPNTATAVWVDVRGVGFESLTFSATAFDSTQMSLSTAARVYLVAGTGAACSGAAPNVCANTLYSPSGSGGVFTAGPSAECVTPTVISGTELFCKLNLQAGKLTPSSGAVGSGATAVVPNGPYSLVVVSNGSPNASGITQSVLSSGSTFTVSDF